MAWALQGLWPLPTHLCCPASLLSLLPPGFATTDGAPPPPQVQLHPHTHCPVSQGQQLRLLLGSLSPGSLRRHRPEFLEKKHNRYRYSPGRSRQDHMPTGRRPWKQPAVGRWTSPWPGMAQDTAGQWQVNGRVRQHIFHPAPTRQLPCALAHGGTNLCHAPGGRMSAAGAQVTELGGEREGCDSRARAPLCSPPPARPHRCHRHSACPRRAPSGHTVYSHWAVSGPAGLSATPVMTHES